MLWKRLWTCRKTGCVMMTITRQRAGELRKSESIPGIGKGVLSTPKRPDGLYAPLCRLSRGTGRSFCCTKMSETCRCLLLFSLRMNLVVPPTLPVLMLSKTTAPLLQRSQKFNLPAECTRNGADPGGKKPWVVGDSATMTLPPIRYPRPATCKIT